MHRYHISVVIAMALLVLLAYFMTLGTLDGLIEDYGIWASARSGGQSREELENTRASLARQLEEKQSLLNSVTARGIFTQTSLQELAGKNDCRLIQFESRNALQEEGLVYEVSYTGSFVAVANLIYALETRYLVRVRTIALTPANQGGTAVKAKITLAVENHELQTR